MGHSRKVSGFVGEFIGVSLRLSEFDRVHFHGG